MQCYLLFSREGDVDFGEVDSGRDVYWVRRVGNAKSVTVVDPTI